jgi:TPR repeat protein
MLLVGVLLERGVRSGAPELEEAATWYERAAEQNNAVAQSYLAQLLLNEEFSGRDPARGLELLNNSAAKGESLALYLLGKAHEEGKVVTQDYSAALQWYTRSSDAGYSRAMIAIGEMYEYGRGVAVSRIEAVRWYKLAADHFDRDAVARLATLGEDVSQYQSWVNQQQS